MSHWVHTYVAYSDGGGKKYILSEQKFRLQRDTDLPRVQDEKCENLQFDYEVQTRGNKTADEERTETATGHREIQLLYSFTTMIQTLCRSSFLKHWPFVSDAFKTAHLSYICCSVIIISFPNSNWWNLVGCSYAQETNNVLENSSNIFLN